MAVGNLEEGEPVVVVSRNSFGLKMETGAPLKRAFTQEPMRLSAMAPKMRMTTTTMAAMTYWMFMKLQEWGLRLI